jgi:hypothetical protein
MKWGTVLAPKRIVLLVRADQKIHRPEAQFFMFLPIK